MPCSELGTTAGEVNWMDHLDAAPGVAVNNTRIAADTTTKLTVMVVSMASYDPATVGACLDL